MSRGGAPLFDPERMRAALEEAGADALLVATAPNVLYLTRYRKGGRAMALVRRDAPERPLLVVPAGDADFLLEDPAEGVEARAFGEFHRFRADDVKLTGRDARIDAVARAAVPDANAIDLMAEALPGATVITDVLPAALGSLGDVARLEHRPDFVRELRMVKTSEELERLAAAAQITEQAIVHTNARIAPGVRQAELARAFAVSVAEQGAAVRLANIATGTATALGNVNRPGDVVADGDLIRYDVGVVHEGYVSDLSRCFSVGQPGEKAVRYHRALVAGQAAALEVLRAGARACDLFATAVEAVRAAGIPHYERINVGHGIGLAGDGYDAPLLAPQDETVIAAGTVLCMETPYYELGFAGLQVEDMVVVTEAGYEPLSHLERDLEVLG